MKEMILDGSFATFDDQATIARIAPRESERDHLNNVEQLRSRISAWAAHFSIPEPLWHLWKAKLNLSKIGSTISVDDVDEEGFDEERQQVIRILQTDHRDEKSKSKPLIEHEFALMKQLANVRRIQRGFTFIFLKTATTKSVDYVGELRPPK